MSWFASHHIFSTTHCNTTLIIQQAYKSKMCQPYLQLCMQTTTHCYKCCQHISLYSHNEPSVLSIMTDQMSMESYSSINVYILNVTEVLSYTATHKRPQI